jgi:ABC-type multidrug transport system fused ATPase/permease subunit
MNFIELTKYFDKSQKTRLTLFFIFILFVSFFETLGLGALIPLMKILSNPEVIYQYLPNSLSKYLNFYGNEDKIKIFTLSIFSTIYVINYYLRTKLLELQTKLPYEFGAYFSAIIFNNVIQMDYKWHVGKNSSEIVDVIANKTGSIVGMIIMTLTIISALCISVFISVFLFYTSIEIMTILTALIIINYTGFTFIYRKKFISQSEKIAIQSTQNIKIIQESLRGIRDIILDNTQKYYVEKFSKSTFELRNAQADSVFMANKPKIFLETLIIILAALVIYYIDIKNSSIENWLPTIAVVSLGVQKVIPHLQSIFTSRSIIISNSKSFNEAMSYLKLNLNSLPNMKFNTSISDFESLEFTNVSYSNTNFDLKSLNFKINAGDRIGIIGETGSGKSTLLDILMGLIEPKSGDIYLNNLKIKSNYMRIISHVPQNIFIFDGTILDNIILTESAATVSDHEFESLLVKCQLYDFVTNLKEGINTKVGENGIKLSGGQRQRIGIARALFKKPKILVLDEATSALDSDTESRIMDAIYNDDKKITLVIVAHRTATLSKCNHIFKITKGTIQECIVRHH